MKKQPLGTVVTARGPAADQPHWTDAAHGHLLSLQALMDANPPPDPQMTTWTRALARSLIAALIQAFCMQREETT